MTDDTNKKKSNLRISVDIIIFVIIIMVVYTSVNLFKSFIIEKVETEAAKHFTYSEFISVNGIVLRDESVIVSDNDYENIIYKSSSGDRVSKSGVIASCYTVDLSPEDSVKLKKYESRISQLHDSIKSGISIDLPSIESNIISNTKKLLSAFENRDFSEALKAGELLHVNFNQKDIKVNKTNYYSQVLTFYENAKSELLKSYNAGESNITAGKAGYFVTGFDGYEYLTAADYPELTVKDFNILYEMKPKNIPINYIGKIETSPSWFYFCVMDSVKASELYIGKKIPIRFDIDGLGSREINFFVAYISSNQNGQTAVKFRSDSIAPEYFNLRKEAADIILTSYTGYKIPTDALRVVDGKTGVYVLSATIVSFKPVNVLYAANTFAIVEPATSTGKKMISENDAVIIGGKELYDGKIIQQ